MDNAGYLPVTEHCSPVAKIWDGEWFVSFASQSSFDEIYLPSNFYLSSGSSCAEPSGNGPASGWVSAASVQ